MMGRSHAATGVLAGVAVAAAFGAHGSDYFILAAVGAGAALLPDLDEPGSTVGRSLGGLTQGVSRWTRRLSSAAFRATATRWDTGRIRREEDGEGLAPGGHRHLTHTLPAVAVYGLLAWGTASLGPIGLGVTVAAMAALGLGLVLREIGVHSTPRRRDDESTMAWRARARMAGLQTVGVLAVGLGMGAVVLDGGAPWLVGVTVAVGALVHIGGDWLTRAGVPLAWPVPYRGKRWRMFRSPVAFHTGKSKVEDGIRWASLAGAPMLALLAEAPL